MMIDTLPKQLRENARRFADRTALREKRFGIWQSQTWREYYENVRDFALGLHRLGFQHGDRIAIIGDNRPEWVISELAAQSLGGSAIGIYQDSVAEEVAYIAELCQARYIVVEDQEQVDKLIEIREKLPTVEKLIYFDPKGLRHYSELFLMSFPDVLASGCGYHPENPGLFDEMVDGGKGSNIALVSTTSGTTSRPKLASITHDNLIAMGEGLISFVSR
jgi:long-chain acyl-CoA synthetase